MRAMLLPLPSVRGWPHSPPAGPPGRMHLGLQGPAARPGVPTPLVASGFLPSLPSSSPHTPCQPAQGGRWVAKVSLPGWPGPGLPLWLTLLCFPSAGRH